MMGWQNNQAFDHYLRDLILFLNFYSTLLMQIKCPYRIWKNTLFVSVFFGQ